MIFFFFFKQKTAYEMRISDWSSDVCSSDLHAVGQGHAANGEGREGMGIGGRGGHNRSGFRKFGVRAGQCSWPVFDPPRLTIQLRPRKQHIHAKAPEPPLPYTPLPYWDKSRVRWCGRRKRDREAELIKTDWSAEARRVGKEGVRR